MCFLGVIGQHAIVTPPVTAPPQQLAHPSSGGIVARMPMGADQFSSSAHPNSGVSLVRPVPQQPSPVRVSLNLSVLWRVSLSTIIPCSLVVLFTLSLLFVVVDCFVYSFPVAW